MAKPTKHNWSDIRRHYEAGMTQSQIVLEFECPKSSLSERIKKEKWEQSEHIKSYIKGSIEVNEQKSNLIEQDVRMAEIANNIINEQLRRRGLLFSGVEKAVKKMADLIDYGKIEEKINVAPGVQQFEERKLNTSDIKNALDGFDKASITLGINERFNSKVEVNNANVQEIEEKRVTIIRRSDNLNND